MVRHHLSHVLAQHTSYSGWYRKPSPMQLSSRFTDTVECLRIVMLPSHHLTWLGGRTWCLHDLRIPPSSLVKIGLRGRFLSSQDFLLEYIDCCSQLSSSSHDEKESEENSPNILEILFATIPRAMLSRGKSSRTSLRSVEQPSLLPGRVTS